MTALLEVGYVGKAHGLKGEVVVHLTTDRIEERTAPGAVFVVAGEASVVAGEASVAAGQPELVVRSARLQQRKATQELWVMGFEGVTGREAAEALRSTVLSAEPIEDPDAVFAHDVIGCRLVDQHGTVHGEIVALVANPASDLLELADGRLVPLAFLESADDQTVHVDVPDGLL